MGDFSSRLLDLDLAAALAGAALFFLAGGGEAVWRVYGGFVGVCRVVASVVVACGVDTEVPSDRGVVGVVAA